MPQSKPTLKEYNEYGHTLGYNYFGPMLFNFTLWLIEEADRHNIHKLYFLSRDGWMLKRIFDIIHSNFPTKIRSHYLYSSRRALWLATVDEKMPEEEYLERLLHAIAYVTLGQVFKRLNLNPNNYVKTIHECNFKGLEHTIASATDFKNLKKLLIILKPDILKNLKEERDSYIEYLQQEGLLDLPKSALVDVGWTGSSQFFTHQLMKAVDPKIPLLGFYLALRNKAQNYIKKDTTATGFLFNYPSQKNKNAKYFFKSYQIIELILCSGEASLIKMSKSENSLHPVLDEYNKVPTHQHILNIQQGIIDYANHTCKAMPTLTTHTKASIPLSYLFSLLKKPTPKFAQYIGDCIYSMDFDLARKPKHLAKPQPVKHYYLHPIRLIKDYRAATWKLGFRAQLPFVQKCLIDLFLALNIEPIYTTLKKNLNNLRDCLLRK